MNKIHDLIAIGAVLRAVFALLALGASFQRPLSQMVAA
jgi:hypothetical protein